MLAPVNIYKEGMGYVGIKYIFCYEETYLIYRQSLSILFLNKIEIPFKDM